jgi:uncharacterized protein YciI
MNWYLVIRRMGEPPASWASLIDAHLAWLHAMHDQGVIVMSGPSTDLSLGIYVMRAKDAAEATRLAGADPLLRTAGSALELIEWQLHQILGIGAFSTTAS